MFNLTDFLSESEFRFRLEPTRKYYFCRTAGLLWMYDLSNQVQMCFEIIGYENGTLYTQSNGIGSSMAQFSFEIEPHEFLLSAEFLNIPAL